MGSARDRFGVGGSFARTKVCATISSATNVPSVVSLM